LTLAIFEISKIWFSGDCKKMALAIYVRSRKKSQKKEKW
jgi:hypothetical protein